MRITEYVGKEGVISSKWDHSRAAKPHPGDLIRWNTGEIGRVEQVGDVWGKTNHAHVCYSMGSAFLGILLPNTLPQLGLLGLQSPHPDSGPVRLARMWKAKPYVSISGGPFAVLPLDIFECTYELHPSHMWNWGDNLPGADMGVQYTLYRPLFNIDRPKPTS